MQGGRRRGSDEIVWYRMVIMISFMRRKLVSGDVQGSMKRDEPCAASDAVVAISIQQSSLSLRLYRLFTDYFFVLVVARNAQCSY